MKLPSLDRDNIDSANSWLLVDEAQGIVVIANQRNGEASTGKATLKKREFLRFAQWYVARAALEKDHAD